MVDVRIMSVGITRREPITLVLKNGLMDRIEGGALAEDFTRILADFQGSNSLQRRRVRDWAES